MTDLPDHASLVRAALLDKALADARQRAAFARRLRLTEREVLAVQYLARAGELAPGQLAKVLQLSSGGATALVQRLQHAGYITRHSHPRDRRSTVLRLAPAIVTETADAWAPLVSEIDELFMTLPERDRDRVRHFLETTADAAERHADRLAREADASAYDELAIPSPALWA